MTQVNAGSGIAQQAHSFQIALLLHDECAGLCDTRVASPVREAKDQDYARQTGPENGYQGDCEDEKRKGILRSMRADRQTFQGKRVLVVDDILDSGYTVREAARALRESQAAEVHVLTLTKTHDFLDQTLGTRHG